MSRAWHLLLDGEPAALPVRVRDGVAEDLRAVGPAVASHGSASTPRTTGRRGRAGRIGRGHAAPRAFAPCRIRRSQRRPRSAASGSRLRATRGRSRRGERARARTRKASTRSGRGRRRAARAHAASRRSPCRSASLLEPVRLLDCEERRLGAERAHALVRVGARIVRPLGEPAARAAAAGHEDDTSRHHEGPHARLFTGSCGRAGRRGRSRPRPPRPHRPAGGRPRRPG